MWQTLWQELWCSSLAVVKCLPKTKLQGLQGTAMKTNTGPDSPVLTLQAREEMVSHTTRQAFQPQQPAVAQPRKTKLPTEYSKCATSAPKEAKTQIGGESKEVRNSTLQAVCLAYLYNSMRQTSQSQLGTANTSKGSGVGSYQSRYKERMKQQLTARWVYHHQPQ